MKPRNITWAVTVLVVFFITTGCWDRKEINDVAILLATALDEGQRPGTYEALVQIAIPRKLGAGQEKAGGGGKPYMPVTIRGTNIEKMRIDEERQLSRDLLSSHRRVFIISESVARRGIKDILDEISRNPQNRLRTFLIVARNMRARDLISKEYPLELLPGEPFREIVNHKMKIPTSLRDFFISSATPGIDPIAASFSKRDGGANYSLDSIAIFRDFKLVGFVDNEQAMALNSFFTNEPLEVIKIRYPHVQGDILVKIDKLHVYRKLSWIEGQPSFNFQVKALARILENTTNLDLSNPKNLDRLNEIVVHKLEDLYKSLFKKLQTEYQTDSIGLGAMIYKKNPNYWEKIKGNWGNIYKAQKMNWEVKADIIGTGTIGAPLYLSEDELKK